MRIGSLEKKQDAAAEQRQEEYRRRRGVHDMRRRGKNKQLARSQSLQQLEMLLASTAARGQHAKQIVAATLRAHENRRKQALAHTSVMPSVSFAQAHTVHATSTGTSTLPTATTMHAGQEQRTSSTLSELFQGHHVLEQPEQQSPISPRLSPPPVRKHSRTSPAPPAAGEAGTEVRITTAPELPAAPADEAPHRSQNPPAAATPAGPAAALSRNEQDSEREHRALEAAAVEGGDLQEAALDTTGVNLVEDGCVAVSSRSQQSRGARGSADQDYAGTATADPQQGAVSDANGVNGGLGAQGGVVPTGTNADGRDSGSAGTATSRVLAIPVQHKAYAEAVSASRVAFLTQLAAQSRSRPPAPVHVQPWLRSWDNRTAAPGLYPRWVLPTGTDPIHSDASKVSRSLVTWRYVSALYWCVRMCGMGGRSVDGHMRLRLMAICAFQTH